MIQIKKLLPLTIGGVGAFIAGLFGGWDTALATLIILMTADYVTGFVVAAVFKNSTKSKNGALESRAGFKGLCRKGVILLVVLIACRMDMTLGTDYIRNTVIIAFSVNEVLSIIENVGLMGVPVPNVLKRAVALLKEKEDENA